MKKLFSTILILGLLLSGNANADTKIIDIFKFKPNNEVLYTVYTLYIDGCKFIITQDIDIESRGSSNNPSVSSSTSVNNIQFMIIENGKMVPAKCQ
jgi:hypothetical protein